MTLSREATEAAYQRHRNLHDAGRWAELANLFAADGEYTDPFFGKIVGRDAVRAFLIKSMTGLEDWTFPISWVAIDRGRVVTHWHNRLPGHRTDGSHFEVPGITSLAYNDAGEVVEQMDMYDRATMLQVIAEARSRVVESTVAGVQAVGRPLVMGVHWLIARTGGG